MHLLTMMWSGCEICGGKRENEMFLIVTTETDLKTYQEAIHKTRV